MIVTAVRCRGTGCPSRLNSLIVPTTRNSPAGGGSPYRATCSANPPPLDIPARNTGVPPASLPAVRSPSLPVAPSPARGDGC
jgi:hypothetical protein